MRHLSPSWRATQTSAVTWGGDNVTSINGKLESQTVKLSQTRLFSAGRQRQRDPLVRNRWAEPQPAESSGVRKQTGGLRSVRLGSGLGRLLLSVPAKELLLSWYHSIRAVCFYFSQRRFMRTWPKWSCRRVIVSRWLTRCVAENETAALNHRRRRNKHYFYAESKCALYNFHTLICRFSIEKHQTKEL